MTDLPPDHEIYRVNPKVEHNLELSKLVLQLFAVGAFLILIVLLTLIFIVVGMKRAIRDLNDTNAVGRRGRIIFQNQQRVLTCEGLAEQGIHDPLCRLGPDGKIVSLTPVPPK